LSPEGAPTLPTDDWVKTMKSLNEKTRKLQEEYEYDCVKHKVSTGTSAGFWLGGSMPPCRLRRRKFFENVDYEMVHSEVYRNKYVVSIAPFSTPRLS